MLKPANPKSLRGVGQNDMARLPTLAILGCIMGVKVGIRILDDFA
jgi:hypothetical protein